MTLHKRPILLAAALALSACTYNNGMPNQPGTGALVGGVSGAVIGKAVGGDDRSAIIGSVAGAVIGGAIGETMARQERELNQQLYGTGVQITNTGDQLRVILPEGVTFPTGSATVNAGFLPALRELARSLRTTRTRPSGSSATPTTWARWPTTWNSAANGLWPWQAS